MEFLLVLSILLTGNAFAATATGEKAATDSAAEAVADFKKKMAEQLAELQIEIDRLQAIAKSEGQKAGDRVGDELERLEKKRADLQKSVDEATTKGGRAWAQVRTGFEHAYKDLKKAFAKAQNELKGKSEK